jgi:hypothetical protein
LTPVLSGLTDGQRNVLRAFYEFGPMDDTALTVYVHHVADKAMSSSGIRTRRAELTRTAPPLLQAVDTKRLKSGRRAAIHALTPTGYALASQAAFAEQVNTAGVESPVRRLQLVAA